MRREVTRLVSLKQLEQEFKSPYQNEERARCQRFGAAARREEENILHGSSTDEQRSSSAKDRQPGGLFSGGRLAALLLSHRALWLCSFVAPCQPPARKQRAHSLLMRWVPEEFNGRKRMPGEARWRHEFQFATGRSGICHGRGN